MSASELPAAHEIADLETLKVMADPLRVQIIEILIPESLPVKQIAHRLGLAPTKLYYHVNQLEEHGLIEVVDTRLVSGIVEKHYRAVARTFHLPHELLSTASPEGREGVSTAIVGAIDSTREDILRTIEARQFEIDQGATPHPRQAYINRHRKLLTEEEAEEFHQRLSDLAREFDERPESEGATQPWGLLLAYYPSIYFPEDELADEN